MLILLWVTADSASVWVCLGVPQRYWGGSALYLVFLLDQQTDLENTFEEAGEQKDSLSRLGTHTSITGL